MFEETFKAKNMQMHTTDEIKAKIATEMIMEWDLRVGDSYADEDREDRCAKGLKISTCVTSDLTHYHTHLHPSVLVSSPGALNDAKSVIKNENLHSSP